MNRVYALDMSGQLDTQIINFTHPKNPTAEKFKEDAEEAFEADRTKADKGLSMDKLMVKRLEKAGYVRAVTATYLFEEGEVIEE